MNSDVKARETRSKNQEARSKLLNERAAAISAARRALERVFEDENATPDQILKAAEMLTKLGIH